MEHDIRVGEAIHEVLIKAWLRLPAQFVFSATVVIVPSFSSNENVKSSEEENDEVHREYREDHVHNREGLGVVAFVVIIEAYVAYNACGVEEAACQIDRK